MNRDEMTGLLKWRWQKQKILSRDGPREISERLILISWHEIYLIKERIWIYEEKDDGILEVNRFPKRQSVMVTKVDPLTGNRQIFSVIIGELVIGIGKRFGYNEGFESSTNLIKTNNQSQWADH